MKTPTRQSLQIGDLLPHHQLAATGGQTLDLAELTGRVVVLFFYPRDQTPGCRQEAHEFSERLSKFRKLGAEVLGVSRDSVKSHEKFKTKEGFKLDLLSDEAEQTCAHFGVMKLKNMYGKQVRGIERSTFVFDRDGKLVKEWRGVKVEGHADEVLAYVKSL